MDRISDDVKPRRRYDSRLRREQAARTRHAVIEAAERLFMDLGYAATTVAAVAEAADVSVETIYKGFGGKGGLARAVFETGLAGSGPVPAFQRSDAMQARAEDARSFIRGVGPLLVEVSRRAAPFVALVRNAAAHDADAASLIQQIDDERLTRMEQNARRLLALPGLRAGLTLAAARDVMWTYSAPELYELLVLRRGWTPEAFGDLAVRGMSAVLLSEPGAGATPNVPTW